MKNKYIEPLISLLIVGAIFTASLYLILGANDLLDKQLKASVYESISFESKEETASLLAARASEQIGTMIGSDCFDQAYQDFEAAWNQECQNQGLENKCDLPRHIANELTDQYEEAKKDCRNQ